MTPKSITAGSAKKNDVNRKVWVQFKATGDTIEINPDKSKPQNLSKEDEIEWERSASKNVLKYKNLVESGQLIPCEIRQKLESKTNRTPQEEEILRNEKLLSNKREKVKSDTKKIRGRGMVFGLGKQTVNSFFENENFEVILFSEFQGEANASPVPRPLYIMIGFYDVLIFTSFVYF